MIAHIGFGIVMPFSDAAYEPETLALLTDTFEAVCSELGISVDDALTRKMIAIKIMAAAAEGERDPERLKLVAIEAVRERS